MPADRKASWIKKHGQSKAVKEWLVKNPPPADFTGTPQEWAFGEMEDEPESDEEPLLPADDDGTPITQKQHDELRSQVAKMANRFRNAIRKTRTAPPGVDEPPAPPAPTTGPKKLTGVAGLLAPLKKKG
jgi:hypothetical protein